MTLSYLKSCSRRTRKRAGFYTLELAISLAILLFLYAILSVQGGAVIESSMTAKARSEVSAIGNAVAEYALEIGKYPDNLEHLTQKEGQYGPWLKNLPDEDPWGNVYQYKSSDNGFAVYSYGADKTDSGSNADEIKSGDIGVVGK